LTSVLCPLTTASIAHQFTGAVGPAFDPDDLALILGSGSRLTFASTSSDCGVTAAAESTLSLIRRTDQLQEVIGVAALLQAPRAGLLGAVRALTEFLRNACPSNIDLVAGGVTTDEKPESLTVTVSIWVRMR
jgi:hypothetical protein